MAQNTPNLAPLTIVQQNASSPRVQCQTRTRSALHLAELSDYLMSLEAIVVDPRSGRAHTRSWGQSAR